MPSNKREFDLSSASVAFDAVLVGGDACPDQGGGGDAYPDQGGGGAYPKREEEVWQEEEVEQEEEAVKGIRERRSRRRRWCISRCLLLGSGVKVPKCESESN